MVDYMKKPCKHCPYRRDVRPFLHPSRGEELAYAAGNRYNDFPCHKTTESDDDSESGEMMVVETSKTCAGFLTLMANECGEEVMPEGFEPSYSLVYCESYDMAGAYEEGAEFPYY